MTLLAVTVALSGRVRSARRCGGGCDLVDGVADEDVELVRKQVARLPLVADRKLVRLPLHINDEAFADALVAAWREAAASAEKRQPSVRAHAPHR